MDPKKSPLAEKILTNITQDNIRPREKSFFVMKNAFNWIKVFVACFLGGHSLGILLYFFNDFDFNLLPLFLKTPEKKFLIFGVLLWFALFIVGAIFTFREYRKTRKGYKTENGKLAFIITLGVFLIGQLSYRGEFSQYFDKKFGEHIPVYQSWESVKVSLWSRPERGFLAGKIVGIQDENITKIIDMTGKEWIIDSSNARVRRRVVISPHITVKIMGVLEGDVFKANEVRPWQGKGRCRNAKDKEKCLRSSH